MAPQQPKGERIMVEYGHPNTHKLPHIGHLFSYFAGDSLAKILEAQGNSVRKVNYQGDIGLHVAKCLYSWTKRGKPRPDSLEEKVNLLQQCYEEGSQLFDSSEEAAQEIQQLNEQIYDTTSAVQGDWQETRQWSLDFYAQLEQTIGVEQQTHYLESQIWEKGVEIVRQNIGTVFTESEGAVIFEGEKLKLHNRVFITQRGTPTYEAKDIGLNATKLKDWPFELTVISTAREQNEYFQVIIAAINQALPDLKDKIKHIGFGHVNLETGKMSSRTGNIVSAPQLLEAANQQAAEVVKQLDISEAEKDSISAQVALGALKYAFLKTDLGKNIEFDIKRDISLQGNSGPYLQYAHARIKSILRKASDSDDKITTNPVLQREERLLLLKFVQYHEAINRAAQDYSPHHLCNYLYECAKLFNQFYERHKVLGTDQQALRLKLIKRTANILHDGLALLGISALERM
jgi:arginyl-tRNA synthetase